MDNDLIKRILNSEKDLFNQIIAKYYKEIFKYTYNQINDYHMSQDLVNEIFLKTYNSLKKYNERKSSFRTWIYKIATNHIINFYKSKDYKQKYTTKAIFDEQIVSKEDILESKIKEEKISEIVMAIKKVLNEKQQKIINLHYFSGLTVKEISQSLHIPEKTIYKSIKSSIQKIKKEVEIDG